MQFTILLVSVGTLATGALAPPVSVPHSKLRQDAPPYPEPTPEVEVPESTPEFEVPEPTPEVEVLEPPVYDPLTKAPTLQAGFLGICYRYSAW